MYTACIDPLGLPAMHTDDDTYLEDLGLLDHEAFGTLDHINPGQLLAQPMGSW